MAHWSGHDEGERGAEILGRLLQHGQRMTGPRRTIVEYVAPRTDNFSAQEILEQLNRRGVDVGRATVFRTLDLLVELGLLHRIHTEDGSSRYAVCDTRHHHHHFLCIECGAVQTVEAPGIEVEIQRFAERSGLEVANHVLELVGRCGECAQARRARGLQ